MSETKPTQDAIWLNDPDLKNAGQALQRAAERARERARRYGHGIVVYEDGKIVEKPVRREPEGK